MVGRKIGQYRKKPKSKVSFSSIHFLVSVEKLGVACGKAVSKEKFSFRPAPGRDFGHEERTTACPRLNMRDRYTAAFRKALPERDTDFPRAPAAWPRTQATGSTARRDGKHPAVSSSAAAQY